MRRFIVVLWAVFGFIGLGVLLGYLWLDRALDRTRLAKPTVQFVGSERSDRIERPLLPRSVSDRPPSDDDETTQHVLRIAEIHVLIEAEVASEELQEQFCAAVELVPVEALDRLSSKHPALAATIATVCRVGAPTDAGAEE